MDIDQIVQEAVLHAIQNMTSDQNGQEAVLHALVNLTSGAASDSADRKLVASSPAALHCLTSCLALDGSPAIQKCATYVIRNIINFDEANWSSLQSFVEPLLSLMQKGLAQTVQELGSQVFSDLCVMDKRSVYLKARPEIIEELAEFLACETNLKRTQHWVALSLTSIDLARAEKVVLQSDQALEGRGLGKVHCAMYEGALEDFSYALEMNKTSSLVVRRCLVQTMLKDYSEALKDINEALQSSPNELLFLQERGVVKRLMGDLYGALLDLDRCLELDPDDSECLKHRGFVKFLTGDEAGAHIDGELASNLKIRVPQPRAGIISCLGSLPVSYLEFDL